MKIRPVGVEMFHADIETDGRTKRNRDVVKPTVVFHNFEKEIKTGYFSSLKV